MSPAHTVLWVVGAPGVGKTSLVRALLDHLDPRGERYLTASPKWTIVPGRAALAGHYTGSTFDGADTVPYNGVPELLRSWTSQFDLERNGGYPSLTIFDGDRFSHEAVVRFFDRSSPAGQCRSGPDVSLRFALLTAPDDVLEERRRARGSRQNPSWMAGRATKAKRFAEASGQAARLDARRSVPELLGELLALIGAPPVGGPPGSG